MQGFLQRMLVAVAFGAVFGAATPSAPVDSLPAPVPAPALAPAAPAAAPAPSLGGDLPEYIEQALSPFNRPPKPGEVEDLLGRWRSEGGLRSPEDRILGARLWRLAGERTAALDLLGSLPGDEGGAMALARFERARVLFELGDANEVLHRAPPDWWAACRAISGLPPSGAAELRTEVWKDLSFLATPEEHEAWESVGEAAACAWLAALIEERAFRMAISPDQRLAAHYERLRTARELYYLPRPRFYVGMTHWHGRRGGEWLDDRGLIYLRMGPPDIAVSCGGAGPGGDAFQGDLLATCWVYERPEGYKLYHFSTANKVTRIPSTSGGYYLQEHLGPRAHPRDPFFRQIVKHADLPKSLIRFMSFNLQLSGAADPFDAALDAVEAQHYRQAAKIETRRYADEALIEIPDVPAVRGATMLWEPLRFMNPADRSWQVWIVAALPAGQLTAARAEDAWVYDARGWLATRHSDRVELDSMWNRAVTDRPLGPDAGIPLRAFTVAREGAMPFTLAVFDPRREGFGAWVQDTIDVPRILPLPTVSDIALAQAEGGEWTRDGETFLRVSPDHVTNEDGSLHLYFEVYGVRRTGRYTVDLRLAKDLTGGEIFEMEPRELPFRLEFDSEMPYSRVGSHAIRLDLSGTPEGDYDLAIRVVDRATGTPSLPAVTPIRVGR